MFFYAFLLYARNIAITLVIVYIIVFNVLFWRQ